MEEEEEEEEEEDLLTSNEWLWVGRHNTLLRSRVAQKRNWDMRLMSP